MSCMSEGIQCSHGLRHATMVTGCLYRPCSHWLLLSSLEIVGARLAPRTGVGVEAVKWCSGTPSEIAIAGLVLHRRLLPISELMRLS